MDLNLLEITSKNCYKCDLETIIDNNSQYFWIKLRDFEVETESEWLNVFNKYGNKSALKYKREITPDIKFQADRVFVRNDLFEQVIKSCKATNIEFTMFKEKRGICLYEENYYTEEIIQIQNNTKEPSIKEISKVSNTKSTKKLIDESDNESINESINKSVNKSSKNLINKSDNESTKKLINKSINEPDNKSINKTVNSNTTSWYDTDKFNKILAAIDNNIFNHKNKIGKLKFNDINNLVNSIKGNTISEADAKKKINELNEIKKVETNGKKLVENLKKLLSLFDDLKTTFNENESENENESVNENENENENKSDDGQYYLEQINNNFKEINETKSFEDQINFFKKIPDLGDYWDIEYYEDNKEANLRLFKLKLAHILNDVDDNLFKEIFGSASEELANKLINTRSNEDNQMIIDHIEIKKG